MNRLSNFLILAGLLIVSSGAFATPELYLVETMVCEGQLNQRPPGWDSSFDKAHVKVTSFYSVRRDCTLADSSATTATYFEAAAPIPEDSAPEITGWYGPPLKKNADKVTMPNGAWPDEVELTVTASTTSATGQTDTLQGREMVLQKDGQDYYYDLTCQANVVEKASIVENHTHTCAPR